MNSNQPMKTRKVIFYGVKTPQEKIQRLIQITEDYFFHQKQILLLTENSSIGSTIDLLLWKHPKSSFLPHNLLEAGQQSHVLIANLENDITNFPTIFNLTPQPMSHKNHILIYEFDDKTDPKKTQISKNHYHFYKENGFSIVSL